MLQTENSSTYKYVDFLNQKFVTWGNFVNGFFNSTTEFATCFIKFDICHLKMFLSAGTFQICASHFTPAGKAILFCCQQI